MKKKGVHKGGSQLGLNKALLSPQQKDVLYLLTQEYLTPKKIAIRRKTSIRAVYKTINKLRLKGYLSGGVLRGFTILEPLTLRSPKSLKNLKKYIRLHSQEWNIDILYSSNTYQELRLKANTIILDNNTIRLYRDSIEIYSGKDFKAEDEQRATALSFQYWNKFFRRLEDKFKVILVKQGHSNINLVNNHYAEVNNELAKEYNKAKIKLRIFTREDGKLWFTIDYSFKKDEAETLHPKTAKPDMTKVRNYFNDIRDKEIYSPSEIKGFLDQTIVNLNELTTNFNSYNQNITKHLSVLGSMDKTLIAIRKDLKGTKRYKKVKTLPEYQLRLGIFENV